jgi:hypothetical protein
MTDRTYGPTIARRIPTSERQNRVLVTDLTELACHLAVDRRRPVSEDEARPVASDLGLEFDADGWVDEPRNAAQPTAPPGALQAKTGLLGAPGRAVWVNDAARDEPLRA